MKQYLIGLGLGALGVGLARGCLDANGLCAEHKTLENIVTYAPITIGALGGTLFGMGFPQDSSGNEHNDSFNSAIEIGLLSGIVAGALTGVGYVFGYGAGKLM
jgi:hypothetical protein